MIVSPIMSAAPRARKETPAQEKKDDEQQQWKLERDKKDCCADKDADGDGFEWESHGIFFYLYDAIY
jgi:hypothetical protein